MAEAPYSTPAVDVEDLKKKVANIESYVANTIRARESARIARLEQDVLRMQQHINYLDGQISDLQAAFVAQTGRPPQSKVLDL